jgi:ABC-type dipeptide/oligopeptide/nickel transport system permease component
MILPWITLAAVQAAFYTRLSRGQLLGGVVVVVASIIVDLVYALLDPGSGSPEAR